MGAHSRGTPHRFNPKGNQLLALPEEEELGFRKDVKDMEAIQDEARFRELALAVVTVSSLSEFEARTIG